MLPKIGCQIVVSSWKHFNGNVWSYAII